METGSEAETDAAEAATEAVVPVVASDPNSSLLAGLRKIVFILHFQNFLSFYAGLDGHMTRIQARATFRRLIPVRYQFVSQRHE